MERIENRTLAELEEMADDLTDTIENFLCG